MPSSTCTPLDAQEFEAWFRLAHGPGISRGAARALLATFGTPLAVLAARDEELRLVVPAKVCDILRRPDPSFPDRLARAWRWLQDDTQQRHLLVLGDPRFPSALLQTADPPLTLFVEGDVAALQSRCLAVVGSRNPTAQGRIDARAFAAELARRGLCVVSGLAQGIDRAAHEGALSVAGACTVAVIGTGSDQVYPSAHTELAAQIVGRGAIVSEYAPGTPPLAENFPRRNRIIAGISRGCLVVEAAERSGSLITARLAAENGRDVFAIPGSIHSPLSKGCHKLIKQGAKLVERAEDILEELRWESVVAAAPVAGTAPADPEASRLLDAMGYDPCHLDVMVERTGLTAEQLLAMLLPLELDGHVAPLPGGRYQRIPQRAA